MYTYLNDDLDRELKQTTFKLLLATYIIFYFFDIIWNQFEHTRHAVD